MEREKARSLPSLPEPEPENRRHDEEQRNVVGSRLLVLGGARRTMHQQGSLMHIITEIMRLGRTKLCTSEARNSTCREGCQVRCGKDTARFGCQNQFFFFPFFPFFPCVL